MDGRCGKKIMKKNIFCALSGHGFGHLSQLAPVINILGVTEPRPRIMVAGMLDRTVVERFVHVEFQLDASARDIGLVQSDPLIVDFKATYASYVAMQQNWDTLVEQEMAKLVSWSTDLVVADIPCVTIEAAHKLAIPSVAIASLSWDHVIKAYFPMDDPVVRGWWQRMRDSYAKTTLALFPQPAIGGDTFPNHETIPPLVTHGREKNKLLRQDLNLKSDDHRPLIMVTMGGLPSGSLPLDILAHENRCHWLFKESHLPQSDNFHSLETMNQWLFEDIFASVDAVVSKPGYGTATLSAALGIPMLYVRRGQFPDEDPICQWLAKHSVAMEIDNETFASGRWYDALQTLLRLPHPPVPRCNGAEIAAGKILELLGRVDVR